MRIFKSKQIREQLTETELQGLTDDFKRYKLTGIPTETFGRDAAYDHPNTLSLVKQEYVRHLHLLPPDKPWPLSKAQFNKTSDVHLVYCQGVIYQEYFALIAILSPDAHHQARNNDIMYKLAKSAELFRQKY